MMLSGHDIEADIVGDEIFIQCFVEQIGGDLGVAIFVWQARAHRVGGVEHMLGDERVGHLAAVESPHGWLFSDRGLRMMRARWATKSTGCSISGWWPALSISAKRAPGMSPA